VELLPLDFDKHKLGLEEKHGRPLRDVDVMSSIMFPKEFDDFERFRQLHGPVDKLETRIFLSGLKIAEETSVEIERGKMLVIQLLAQGELNEKGEREVYFELNGQIRSMVIVDAEASKSIVNRPRAVPGIKGSVGAPMPGEILEIKVKEGEEVRQKQTLFVLSAMKMEMNVDAPISGQVKKNIS